MAPLIHFAFVYKNAVVKWIFEHFLKFGKDNGFSGPSAHQAKRKRQFLQTIQSVFAGGIRLKKSANCLPPFEVFNNGMMP